MTAMFHDVHRKTDNKLLKNRVPGADFDEVTYADDTICISTDAEAMNQFIKQIEFEGIRYGMKLNKAKCELITTHGDADIHFEDKTKVPKVRIATYLGCGIGIKASNREELSKRFANTMATMNKLDLFWRNSSCDVAIKIHTADAVLRSKLLYGLESAQLIPSIAKKLETFQLKVLRKILKMDTTFVNRNNTNNCVFQQANQRLEEEGKRKKVVTFIEAYNKLKRKRACKIMRHPGSLLHKITFNGSKLRKWIHPNRRVGRPRMNWTEETVREVWDHLKKDTERYRFTAFNEDNEEIMETLRNYANSDNQD